MALGRVLKKTCQVNLGLKLKFHKYTDLQILTSVEMNVTLLLFLIQVGRDEEREAVLADSILEILISALFAAQCSAKEGA